MNCCDKCGYQKPQPVANAVYCKKFADPRQCPELKQEQSKKESEGEE